MSYWHVFGRWCGRVKRWRCRTTPARNCRAKENIHLNWTLLRIVWDAPVSTGSNSSNHHHFPVCSGTLVLFQWARAPFTLSWKSCLVRDCGEDSSPDWLHPWARSGIEAPCLPRLWKHTGSTRFMPGALCLCWGQVVASRLVIWMHYNSLTCSRTSTRRKEEAGGQLGSIIAHMLRNCVQMEHALIAVKMVLVAWFTFNSFRKQVLAFSVMGQKHEGGYWCAFWCAPTVEHLRVLSL